MTHMLPVAITDFDGDQLYIRNATPNAENAGCIAWLTAIPAADREPVEVGLTESDVSRLIEWLTRQKKHKNAKRPGRN